MQSFKEFRVKYARVFENYTIPYTEDETFQEIQKLKYPEECHNLLRKYFTADVFEKLKGKKTKMGGGLVECCYNAITETDSSIGIHATDQYCYETFALLFDKVIRDYHKVRDGEPISHPANYYGLDRPLPFGEVDKEGKYVQSTRFRVARNLNDYPFPPLMSQEKKNEIESTILDALKKLPAQYQGQYHPLSSLSDAEADKLILKDHFLYRFDDSHKAFCGIYRNWPEGRGIYINKDRTFLVWLNEGDHYRFISIEQGGNMTNVYKRLFEGVQQLETLVKFAHSDKLGNVAFCPTNLGTSMRASVHIRLPELSKTNRGSIVKICKENDLQIRGIHGELSAADLDVYDISNIRRLGLTELDGIAQLAKGIETLIALEKDLENKK